MAGKSVLNGCTVEDGEYRIELSPIPEDVTKVQPVAIVAVYRADGCLVDVMTYNRGDMPLRDITHWAYQTIRFDKSGEDPDFVW